MPRKIDLSRVRIDDTTLRDGEQMPGVYFTPQEKLRIAEYLNDMGIERLENFASYNDADRESTKLIVQAGFKMRVAAWTRASISDIDDLMRTGVKEVGISHPVSDLHLEKKLNITREQALKRIADATQYAKDHGLTIFVHGEDSGRADWKFERQFINTAAEHGAVCYRICDTVGNSLPFEGVSKMSVPKKVKLIRKETKMKEIEIHAHDDLGFAVPNTISALNAGADWASVTLLGLGERAGNCELEKVLLILYYHYGVKKYKLELLTELANYVAKVAHVQMPLNKAVVGKNVFAHESGIHTHGILKEPSTYEIYPPELVGGKRELVVGKHSGKALLEYKIKELFGYQPDDKRLDALLDRVKGVYTNGERKSALRNDELVELAYASGFTKEEGK